MPASEAIRLSDEVDAEMQAMEELLRLSSAKSLVGAWEFIRTQQKEIDCLKANLMSVRSEAIAVIRLKNEEIASLKRRRKP